jgi:hypothetical protein
MRIVESGKARARGQVVRLIYDRASTSGVDKLCAANRERMNLE